MKKLFIATPMYGSQCVGQYASALSQLTYDFGLKGYQIEWRFEYNNSILTLARNYLVHQFLNLDSDYLLFIDADIEFTTKQVLTLMDWATNRKDIKVLSGIYPKKSLPLEYPFGIPKEKISVNQPVKANYIATGFVLIKREVFDILKNAYPEQSHFDNEMNSQVQDYFDFKLIDNKYYGEDVYFSHICKEQNINLWVLPSVKVNHIGNFIFKP